MLWNLRLLEEGLAVYNDYGNPGKYADMSREAAENALLAGVGLWSACTLTFDPTPTPTSHPTPVRTGSGQDAQVGCPQGCVSQPDPSCNIKGNVNKRNDTKIYHIDGESPSYARVNMKVDEGDLWFCTVEEGGGQRLPRAEKLDRFGYRRAPSFQNDIATGREGEFSARAFEVGVTAADYGDRTGCCRLCSGPLRIPQL